MLSPALSELRNTFWPLSLEQGLYLLDKLTWFPESGPNRLQLIADYVAERVPRAPVPTASQVGDVLARILNQPAGGSSGAGRWEDISEAKHLYELKYDLKMALLPDRFFSFMNMGWVDPGRPTADLGAWLGPEERLWNASAHLYERVAGDAIAGRDVLEVGCGRGGGAGYLLRRHGPLSYVALDQSAANLAFGRATQAESISFVKGDAEALNLGDASVDVVVNIESAHCYPHPESFFAEVARVLRPGGRLCLADEWWTASHTQLVDLVRGAGLDVVSEVDLTDGIIESLYRLRTPMEVFIARQPEDRRRIFERFFGERVLVESLRSYTSGRFNFRLVIAERGQA